MVTVNRGFSDTFNSGPIIAKSHSGITDSIHFWTDKKMTRIVFSLIAGGLALLLSCNVHALPITLATGESALFNFDLTTQGAVPFTDVEIIVDVTAPAPGLVEQFNFDIYGELFGVDLVGTFSNLSIGMFTLPVPDGAWAADGLFSIRLTANPGPITITQVNATGLDAAGGTVGVDGAVVPVPATLLLLILGLAGIGNQRRKQVLAG
jgi:hypothetical protein